LTRASTFRRYVLLQAPSWALAAVVLVGLHRWGYLPAWIAAVLLLAFVVKDLALYPWLRRSYAVDTRTPAEQQLVGERAVVTQPLSPRGYVRVRGELWRAEALDPGRDIHTGAAVEVVAARGLTLVVRKTTAEPTGQG